MLAYVPAKRFTARPYHYEGPQEKMRNPEEWKAYCELGAIYDLDKDSTHVPKPWELEKVKAGLIKDVKHYPEFRKKNGFGGGPQKYPVHLPM